MNLAEGYTVRGVNILSELIHSSITHDYFIGNLELCLHVYKKENSLKVALGGLIPINLEVGKNLSNPENYLPLVNGSSSTFVRDVGNLNNSDEEISQMEIILNLEIDDLRNYDIIRKPSSLDSYFHFLLNNKVYRLARTPSKIVKDFIIPVTSS